MESSFINPVEPGEYVLDDIEEYYQYLTSIVGTDKVLILTDMRVHYLKIPTEVLNVIANGPFSKQLRIADAVLVKSLPNRLILNFYINIFKPKEPTKVFNSMKNAEKWLLEKKEKWLLQNSPQSIAS